MSDDQKMDPWRADAERRDCYCATQRKPCPYHEGYEDGWGHGADAVLAVLPSEGWERMVTLLGRIGEDPTMTLPLARAACRQLLADVEFAARRVDGAAPPEPERTWASEVLALYEDAPEPEPIDRHEAYAMDAEGYVVPLPASSTPTEVERLREALTKARESLRNDLPAEALHHIAVALAPKGNDPSQWTDTDRGEPPESIRAALSGQQDTERTE